MTFEEMESAAPDQLRAEAKKCFDEAMQLGVSGLDRRMVKVLESQFYMQELDRREAASDRRESKRISDRDLKLENG